MSNFIHLPTGDYIRADAIFAVRLGDGKEYDDLYKYAIQPRVIVDFGLGGGFGLLDSHSNCVVCNCETNEERDALAAEILRQLA